MKKQNKIPNNGHNIHGTKTVTGVYFSKEMNLSIVNGSRPYDYGSDSERLSTASDSRIRRRVYMMLKNDDQLPQAMIGDGDYAYIAEISGIYNPQTANEEQKNSVSELMEDNSANEFESAVIDAGYTGYLKDDIIVCLDLNVKVKFLGKVSELGGSIDANAPDIDMPDKKALPKSKKTKRLNKNQQSQLSSILPALKESAPSADIKGNVFSVDEHEYPAFLKKAVGFNDVPKFIKSDFDKMGLGKDYATSDKTTKSKRNGNKDEATILNDIKHILMSNKMVEGFSAKTSELLKQFVRESKQFQDAAEKTEENVKEDTKDDIEQRRESSLENVLRDVEEALRELSKESEKDHDKAREKLLDAMERTQNFDKATQEHFTKSVNAILEAIEKEKTQPHVKPKIVPEEEDFDKVPKVEPKVLPRPDLKPEDEPKVEPEGTTEKPKVEPKVEPKPPERPDLKPEDEPKVEPKQETKKPAWKEALDRMFPPTDYTSPQFKKGRKPSPRPKYSKEQTFELPDKTVIKKPSYTEPPKDLSKTDKLLGAFINRKKDITVTDKDGNVLHKRAGANKIGFGKEVLAAGDEYLGRGNTAKLLRHFKPKKSKTIETKESETKKEKVTPKASKPELKQLEVKKPLLLPAPEGATEKPFNKASNMRLKDKMQDVSDATNVKDIPAVATPEADSGSSIISDVADVAEIAKTIPKIKGGAMLGKAAGVLGKAGKIAAPIAAGVAAFQGISDEAEGNKVEGVGDIIPKGGLLNKLNPFGYAMNAGRYVGNKVNEGVDAMSGGTTSIGSKIYDWTHNSEPKLKPSEIKPEVQEIAQANMEKDNEKPENKQTGNTIVSNTTNNTSPTQQILPNNVMSQRNTESAYRSLVNSRFNM